MTKGERMTEAGGGRWHVDQIGDRVRVWTHASDEPELFAANRIEGLRLAVYLNSLERREQALRGALQALDSLYCGFAEVVRTEDWGDGWLPEVIPEVRAAFTRAADAMSEKRVS